MGRLKQTLPLLLAVFLVGCGYQWQTTRPSIDGQPVVIHPFLEVAPFGLTAPLQAALAQEASRHGLTPALPGTEAALHLKGEVIGQSVGGTPVADQRSGVPGYRMGVSLQARLEDSTGKTVWAGRVALSEDYLAQLDLGQGNNLGTESNRQRAIGRLAEQLAHELLRRARVRALLAPGGPS